MCTEEIVQKGSYHWVVRGRLWHGRQCAGLGTVLVPREDYVSLQRVGGLGDVLASSCKSPLGPDGTVESQRTQGPFHTVPVLVLCTGSRAHPHTGGIQHTQPLSPAKMVWCPQGRALG